jgi:MFS family permease
MVEYWKKAAVVTGLGQLSDAADSGVGYIIIPLVIAAWRLGPIEIGWLGSAFTFGAAAGGLISGILMDYIGRKKVWVAGNILAAIGYFLSTTATSWIEFSVYRFIAGFTVASCFAAFFTLMPEEMPPDKRATISGLGLALNTCGIILLSALLALTGMFPWITWQFIVIVVGVIDLALGVAGFLVLREPPIWLERKKLIKEGKIVKEERSSLKMILKPGLRRAFILAMILGISYGFVTLATAGDAGGSFFQSAALKFSAPLIGVLSLVTSVVNICEVAVTGRIADKFGRLNTILMIGILSLIGGQLVCRTPYFLGVGESISVIAFYFITYCLFMWAIRPLDTPVRVWIAEILPTSIRGTAQGILDFIKSLLGAVISIGVGYLAATIGLIEGYSIPPLLGSIFGLIVVVMLARMGLETKGKALE